MLRNIPKSNPYIIAVSTPKKPGDFMDLLLKEPVDKSPFKTLLLDYTYGLGTIYSQEEINKVRGTRSFEREFNLKFLGEQGNIFSPQSIENCTKIAYDLGYCQRSKEIRGHRSRIWQQRVWDCSHPISRRQDPGDSS
jgi:hypothetical protein